MDEVALYRLLSWLSPAFPVGSYAHSSGLEWAIEEGLVTSRAALQEWIADILACGGGRNDAALFVYAHRACVNQDVARLQSLAELATALNPSRERRLETTAQGSAFRRIAFATAPCGALEILAEVPDDELCYPIIVATLAAGHRIGVSQALTAYLHALVSNMVSAAQRLIPLGQTDAQTVIATCEPMVGRVVRWATAIADGDPFDALGSASLMADIASIAHETQTTRLFRT